MSGTRQQIERAVVDRVVAAFLKAGYSLGVFDTEEVTLRRETDEAKVQSALMQTDEDWLLVWSADNPEKPGSTLDWFHLKARGGYRNDPTVDLPDGWVRFVYGNGGWDVVSDYTTNLEPVLKPVDALCDAEDLRALFGGRE